MATNGKKSRKKLIIISAIVVVLVALGLVVFLGSKKEPVLAVNVEKVTARTLTQVVTATGKIQPEVHAQISPEVSGEIVLLPVKEGYRVKKGDILLKIKPDIYIAQRDQFKAGLLARVPLKRVGQTGDLIGALLLFCSDASSFITGQILTIDGGLTATQ